MNLSIQMQSAASFWNLCGSRGTAAVLSFGASTSLDILDLEEDEEDDTSSASGDESCFEE